jgi:hypothetical protein
MERDRDYRENRWSTQVNETPDERRLRLFGVAQAREERQADPPKSPSTAFYKTWPWR